MTCREEFELKWRVGAGTAGTISRIASGFKSKIETEFAGNRIDAKEVMQWLLLGTTPAGRPTDSGLQAGDRITIIAEGPDAEAAMRALTELFTVGERLDRCPHAGCPSTPTLHFYSAKKISYGCSKGHDWEVAR
jgi:phosphotransferase system HPr (HPr) family protein